jgi:hypothetical protein
MFRNARLASALLLFLAFPALARDPLAVHAPDQQPKPEPGKALVVFMRPSSVGFAIASSVYDAPDADTRFIGVVRSKQKMAYQADPGVHRFMVIAENADFMDATLEAGKTYYVLIQPRMGVWKARFSLFPVHNHADPGDTLQNPDFAKWNAKTELVATSPAGLAWYEDNKASVAEKKADYLVKWNRMLDSDRAELTLHPHDGVEAEPASAEAPAVAGETGVAPESPAANDANAAPADAAAQPAATEAAPTAPDSGN